VPISEAVVDDSAIELWDEVQAGLTEAVSITLDQAALMGTNKPASWPAAIVPAAIAATNTAEAGTATAAQGGIVGDIDAALDKVASDGFDATAIAAKRSLRGMLRKARDNTPPAPDRPVGRHGEGAARQLRRRRGVRRHDAGGARRLLHGRARHPAGHDLQILDQAVSTDAAGAVIYNLAQQDMVAMRVVMRIGYAVANPVTRDNPTAATRYPFAVLQDVTP
jgi:capsid protein